MSRNLKTPKTYTCSGSNTRRRGWAIQVNDFGLLPFFSKKCLNINQGFSKNYLQRCSEKSECCEDSKVSVTTFCRFFFEVSIRFSYFTFGRDDCMPEVCRYNFTRSCPHAGHARTPSKPLREGTSDLMRDQSNRVSGKVLPNWCCSINDLYSTKQGSLLHCSHQTLSHSDILHVPNTSQKTGLDCRTLCFRAPLCSQYAARKRWEETSFHYLPLGVLALLMMEIKRLLALPPTPQLFYVRRKHTSRRRPPCSGASRTAAHQLRGISPNLSIEMSLEKRWCIKTQALRDKKLTSWKWSIQPFPDTIIRSEKISMLKLLLMEFNSPNWLIWPTLLGSWWRITW